MNVAGESPEREEDSKREDIVVKIEMNSTRLHYPVYKSVADKNVVRHIFEWSQQHQQKSHCTNGNDVRLLSVYPGLQSCKDLSRR